MTGQQISIILLGLAIISLSISNMIALSQIKRLWKTMGALIKLYSAERANNDSTDSD